MSIIINKTPAITFDDVLIVPGYSEVKSRAHVRVSQKIGELRLGVPIIASNMDTVCSQAMASKMHELRGLGIVHRYMSKEDQAEVTLSLRAEAALKNERGQIAHSVGSIFNDKTRIEFLIQNELADILCVDIAHGHSVHMERTLKAIRGLGYKGTLIAGNVCTAGATSDLAGWGADIVKVGVGGGCFASDTRVLMADGSYKNIQDINVHDRVINKDGNPVQVTKVTFSGYKKVLKYKNTKFHSDTFATPEHQHWIGDYSTSKNIQDSPIRKVLDKVTRFGESKYKWLPLNECTGAAFLIPKKISFDLKETFEVHVSDFAVSRRGMEGLVAMPTLRPSYDLGYVFGAFLGDGCAKITHSDRIVNGKSLKNSSGHTSFYFGLQEDEIANKLVRSLKSSFGMTATIKKTENTTVVYNRNNSVTRLLMEFGKKSEKHLPHKYLCGNTDYLRGILDGLIDSDGHVDGDRIGLTNTSTTLIEQFGVIFKIVNGYFPSVCKREPTAGRLVGCNVENCPPPFSSRSIGNPEYNLTKDFEISRVYEIKDAGGVAIPTYDIEVDCPTHSFIANNLIVHNSVCSTRTQTGVGYPQLQAIIDCTETDIPIIADGGIRSPGDVAKALAAGATAVMIGGMLAGTDMTPNWVDGGVGSYRGMASLEARATQTAHPTNAEGVSRQVKYKPRGSTAHVVNSIVEGLQSAMSYVGASTLEEFRVKARFMLVSGSTNKENHPHFNG